MNIKNLRKLAKMTQKQFAEYFNIPKRTVENWESGFRLPPEYIIELIFYKLLNEKIIPKENYMKEVIKSNKGFFIGDICYVLSDKDYNIWKENNYSNGKFKIPESDYNFVVSKTAHGDGCYTDQHGTNYFVDAGNIGVVPLELLATYSLEGNIVEEAGEIIFEVINGFFEITLPNSNKLFINTN